MTPMMKLLSCSLLALAVAAPAEAEIVFSGDVGVGIGLGQIRSSDDDGENISKNAFRLDGQVRTQVNGFAFMLDASHFGRELEDGEDYDDDAPSQASALGLHAGYMWGDHYVGAFAGRNWFQADDAASDNGTVHGDLYGIEGHFRLPNQTTTFFGQIGKAEMIGDGTDTAFDGTFVRVGMTQQLNEKLNLMIDLEYGRSPDVFEDNNDWGEYQAVGIKAAYTFRPRLIGEAGVDFMHITANSEDNGKDYRAFVGVRIPFGADGTARSPLTTTYKPGLAAAWAETLD